MSPSSLARILGAAIDETPGAVSSSLAASDGELVDAVSGDRGELALLTAHYAIVLGQVRSAFGVFHFGDVVELTVFNRELSILIRSVGDGYLALLTVAPGTPIAPAQRALDRAAELLHAEIA